MAQQFCYHIFSPPHHIVAWSNVMRELLPFQQFSLFDLSNVQLPLNLQQYFTKQWNDTHPYLSPCLTQKSHVSIDFDSDPNVNLICYVDTYDLNTDLLSTTVKTSNTYIRPDNIRPYKLEHEVWSLQKAIQYTFNEALNKTYTMNIWSCGLDPQLVNGPRSDAIETFSAMTLYTLNNIFACTKLLFHLNHPIITSYRASIPSVSSSTPEQLLEQEPFEPPSLEQPISPELPSYFVLLDGHTKFMDPIITTPHYKLIIHSRSGLQWLNSSNTNICTYSLIQKSTISIYLRSSTAIMLLIGTNSLRYVDAAQVV